ncbi:MAG TPA: putative glycoside hydrolase [Gemmatimonadales bacterium]|nr:putative glycoside hydrolase [Gemmatimonadales bacterium]
MHRAPLCTLLLLASLVAPLAGQTARWGDELPREGSSSDRMMLGTPRQLEPVDWPAPPLVPPPQSIRAIYLNAWAFGSKHFYDLVRLADTTEINAFVIDVKDDTGYLTYPSKVPTAIAITANQQVRAPDVRERLAVLHAHGIFPIARIVVAKDPLLASHKPAWSIHDVAGGQWQDRKGHGWVDAFTDSVWVYAGDLGEEAVRMGFGELQFDYVRFPDEPRSLMAKAVYPGRKGKETTRDGVVRNLRLLRDQLKPLGVPFTIDVFGMTASATADMGIGQVWEDLVTTADVVLPMVYPSHYYGGFYEIMHPNSEPYEVVHRALRDGIQRAAPLGKTAEIRPWLQAFTLGAPRYTAFHVKEQIRAVEDLGLKSWVLWNARSYYDAAAFRPAGVRSTRVAAVLPAQIH